MNEGKEDYRRYNVLSTRYHVLSTKYKDIALRSFRKKNGQKTNPYFVLRNWHLVQSPTSSFFNQRSIFDISLVAVSRLPAAGKYFLLRI